jgi:hypothetical protein
MTESLLTDVTASSKEVTMKRIAAEVVSLLKKVAAPLLPKRV